MFKDLAFSAVVAGFVVVPVVRKQQAHGTLCKSFRLQPVLGAREDRLKAGLRTKRRC